MGLNETVVLLRQGDKNKSVFTRIQSFLQSKSELTRVAYEEDIRGFFRLVLGKHIESLSKEDLVKFDDDDVLNYRNALTETYSAGTINRKLSAMRSLYKKLSANKELREVGLDVNVFNVDSAKGDTNGYGSLTWDETVKMIEAAKCLPNGEVKSLIIELAVLTGFRIESILALKWSNFYYNEEKDFWIIEISGEHVKYGKKDKKPITSEFYNRLQKVSSDSDGLFHLTSKTMRSAVRDLCEQMNIDPRRNITFHSLKKTGVNKILKETGDVKAAQRYANHSSAATTLDVYAEMNDDLSEMPSLKFGESANMSILESLTKDELLRLISNSSQTVKQRLIKDAEAKKF